LQDCFYIPFLYYNSIEDKSLLIEDFI